MTFLFGNPHQPTVSKTVSTTHHNTFICNYSNLCYISASLREHLPSKKYILLGIDNVLANCIVIIPIGTFYTWLGKQFYTTSDCDGCDKYQVCLEVCVFLGRSSLKISSFLVSLAEFGFFFSIFTLCTSLFMSFNEILEITRLLFLPRMNFHFICDIRAFVHCACISVSRITQK